MQRLFSYTYGPVAQRTQQGKLIFPWYSINTPVAQGATQIRAKGGAMCALPTIGSVGQCVCRFVFSQLLLLVWFGASVLEQKVHGEVGFVIFESRSKFTR